MSHDDVGANGGGGESSSKRPAVPTPPPLSPRRRSSGFVRPHYMTVGANGPSENAEKLQALLDNDSGYGGSIADFSSASGLYNELRDEPDLPALEGQLPCKFPTLKLHLPQC